MTDDNVKQSFAKSTNFPESQVPQQADSATMSRDSRLHRIVLVTDFSAKSRKTYTYAVWLAKQFGASIQLVHFGRKRAPEHSGISNPHHLKSVRASLAKEAQREEFADVRLKTSFLHTNEIARSLDRLQKEAPFELIVAHTLAHQGLQRHFDHQLAEKIIAKSSVPVLLFGPAAFDSGIETLKSILVPFDFSDKAEATFPALRILDNRYQCAIRFLFVQTMRCRWLYRIMGTGEYQMDTFEHRFEELITEELPGLNVELEIRQGLREYEFCNRACDASADLIVIGTYGKLGKLTKCIIRQATCPVMTVPADSRSR